MGLRDLDDKWVPELARRLDALVHRIPDPIPEPDGPLPVIKRLRRVDDRWTARGPLALVRDIPQVGLLVIAALIATGFLTLRVRIAPDRVADRTQATERGEEEETSVGPDVGERVATYIGDADARLNSAAPGAPDAMVVAVVSFTSFRTPEQVRALVGPVQVRRIFYRPQLPKGQTITRNAGVEDLVLDSRKEFQRIAAIRIREANELLKVAATIENDPKQKADQEKDAALYQREAALLRGPCACVYGIVVRTRLGPLLELRRRPGIRVVDISRIGGEFDDFNYSALLPTDKKTVTGGNQAS